MKNETYTQLCAISAECVQERRKILLFEYTVPGFIEEGKAQVIIDEHLCEWTDKEAYHSHSMPVFASDDSQVRVLAKEPGAELIKLDLAGMPIPVLKALVAVRKVFPSVTMVTYSGDGRWRYTDDDFNPPHDPENKFKELTSLMETASDQLNNASKLPAAFAMPKWAVTHIDDLNPYESC